MHDLRHVLTAGHCIWNFDGIGNEELRFSEDEVYVVPGLHETDNVTSISQFVGARQLFVHPRYLPENHPEEEGERIFDVAVIELNRILQFSEVDMK